MGKTYTRLTVALATHNEAKNIGRCLESVRDIADEIVMVDGNSDDDTVSIAKRYGARVRLSDNIPMFHTNKQKALDMAHGEWLLQLDADEVVSLELKQEIIGIIGNPSADDGYFIPRHNYFLGNWLRKGGQYPDYVIRLFRRGKGTFPQQSVHEQIRIDGTVGHLTHALDHYSYTSVSQYWQKSSSYIRLTAADIAKKSRVNPVSYLVIKPVMTFLSLYIRHKGFLDGWRGFLFAAFSAMHFPASYVLSLSRRP